MFLMPKLLYNSKCQYVLSVCMYIVYPSVGQLCLRGKVIFAAAIWNRRLLFFCENQFIIYWLSILYNSINPPVCLLHFFLYHLFGYSLYIWISEPRFLWMLSSLFLFICYPSIISIASFILKIFFIQKKKQNLSLYLNIIILK